MPPHRPLVIGHRGAPAYRPEHSFWSYEMALRMGADAVEPDIVVSRDGVLVVRHENELGATTDIASRREFAGRRTAKVVDGVVVTGWFAEDFTWHELATLRCREPLPELRPDSAAFDGIEPILRLRDVLDFLRETSTLQGRRVAVIIEIKHATYFAGLGWDVADLLATELRLAGWADGGMPLTIESFESTVLGEVRERGIPADYVYLLDAGGTPWDLATTLGLEAPTYRETATPRGLDALAGRFDGISVAKSMILGPVGDGPTSLVADAHERDLRVFTWTLRPENRFLHPPFRLAGGPAAFGDYGAEWAVIRDAGVDGVFVDHLDLGVEFFGS